jgi:hypothetical protein
MKLGAKRSAELSESSRFVKRTNVLKSSGNKTILVVGAKYGSSGTVRSQQPRDYLGAVLRLAILYTGIRASRLSRGPVLDTFLSYLVYDGLSFERIGLVIDLRRKLEKKVGCLTDLYCTQLFGGRYCTG